MIYDRLEKIKMEIVVIPAWIAGIQAHTMRPETSMSPGFQLE